MVGEPTSEPLKLSPMIFLEFMVDCIPGYVIFSANFYKVGLKNV